MEQLGAVLMKQGAIENDALNQALQEQAVQQAVPLGEILVDSQQGKLIGRLMRSAPVIARGGRRDALGSRVGPWVILAYCTSDLEAFEQEYLAFARTIAR